MLKTTIGVDADEGEYLFYPPSHPLRAHDQTLDAEPLPTVGDAA